MEGNGLSGRMYTNLGGGMLGLEMPQNHLQKHPQLLAFTNQQHPQQLEQQQTQLSMKQPNYTYSSNPNPNPTQNPKTRTTQFTTSDEDEPVCSNDQENSFDGKRKSSSSNSMSPWQRMKWTDSMVRLLIMAVYYIGDEVGGSELGPEKKKPGSGGGAGAGGGLLLQKKGKWKSVSRAMMEKGFYVSPQQCEDKFNDLNKRYKRVNDILGRGTACKVVENQSLLENMEISPKMKEEVKKLLNSKHLFFREMCAYHNSCGHVGNAGPMAAEAATGARSPEPTQQPQQQQQQSCAHLAQVQQSAMMHTNSHRLRLGTNEEDHDDEDEDEDEDDNEYEEEEEEHVEEGGARKRARTMGGVSPFRNCRGLQQLNGEAMGMIQDVSKSSWEKKQWVMTQLVQLEEQGVKFQSQALELEKQRLKWIKFSSKKEREMERMKIVNERKRLENERMLLLLRQKEIELLLAEQQQQQHPA